MQPLEQFDPAIAARIDLVLCDIDDTITTEGSMTARAYQAIEDMTNAGIKVVPITGRPAGWCDHIARMWPVFAVVGENGAFYMRYDHQQRKMTQHFWANHAERQANRQALDELARAIVDAVPGCALASDQPYRIADLAIDFCEDVAPLDDSAIDRIVTMFQQAGAQAKVSSIHVNGWFGSYDKLTMTREMLERELPQMLKEMQQRTLFIGDSANDAPMFRHFNNSVGVANVVDQLHRIETEPTFVCKARSGAGFVELARHLLDARRRVT